MITVQQASVNALAAWLVSQLSGTGATVDTRWPTPGIDLPRKALTILLAGPRTDELLMDPRVLSATNLSTNRTTVRWQLKACEQPIQLDVWAKSDFERDDMLARLDVALNGGDAALSGFYDPAPVSNGMIVKLAGEWSDTFANCTFESADIDDSSDATLRSEYRATIRGTIYVMLSVTKDSARQIAINFGQRLSTSDKFTGGDTTTIPLVP